MERSRAMIMVSGYRHGDEALGAPSDIYTQHSTSSVACLQRSCLYSSPHQVLRSANPAPVPDRSRHSQTFQRWRRRNSPRRCSWWGVGDDVVEEVGGRLPLVANRPEDEPFIDEADRGTLMVFEVPVQREA
jgi:hypothetical protein